MCQRFLLYGCSRGTPGRAVFKDTSCGVSGKTLSVCVTFLFFCFMEDMEDIRKRYGKTSFCVTLKGATISYPQGCKAGLSFLFSSLFSSFSQIWGAFVVFSAGKVRNTYSFHDFDTRISLNGSEKGGKEKNTGGRITALLSLALELAIFLEPKDGNLRRRGFKGTSECLFSITLMDGHVSIFFSEFLSAFFSGYSWHKGVGQLNVGRYDHLIFVIFIGILWDCRDFTAERGQGA